jgi:RimJ/RimL family protein N-acetyltransferase
MRFGNEYGYCELNDFPGNSQIVVSNHAFIYPKYRGKGHGTENHIKRVDRAKDLGYDYMICTVRKNNVAELAILKKEGWKELDEFKNTNTGNDVLIYGKIITKN